MWQIVIQGIYGKEVLVMGRGGDNAYLLSQWLRKCYGTKEFTIQQFIEEVQNFLYLIDKRSHEKYLEASIMFEQIQQTESGNFIATPHPLLSLKMRLARKTAVDE